MKALQDAERISLMKRLSAMVGRACCRKSALKCPGCGDCIKEEDAAIFPVTVGADKFEAKICNECLEDIGGEKKY